MASVNSSVLQSRLQETHQNAETSELFNEELNVVAKLGGREEVECVFRFHVSRAREGPTGVTRVIRVRLTDPSDPFFLFTTVLLEDEYGKFKARHELAVDFSGFPEQFVQMLRSASDSLGHYKLTFTANETNTVAVLRIIEPTNFRALEHLSLDMQRQKDEGLKKYLAERFMHFEAAYHDLLQKSEEERALTTQLISDLRAELATARKGNEESSQLLQLERARAETSKLSSVESVKDEHSRELRQLQFKHESELTAVKQKYESQLAVAQGEIRSQESELFTLKQQLHTLQANEMDLNSRLRQSQDLIQRQTQEIEQYRRECHELKLYRQSATKQLSENEMTAVRDSERLKFLEQDVSSRKEENARLRKETEKSEALCHNLTDQLTHNQEQLRDVEAKLLKANHILGTQHQAFKIERQKTISLETQLRAQEKAFHEIGTENERIKLRLDAELEKLESKNKKIAELEKQLQQAEERNLNLAEQLKNTNNALVSMQRAPSRVPPIAMYSEFQRGTLNTSIPSASEFSRPASAHQSAGFPHRTLMQTQPRQPVSSASPPAPSMGTSSNPAQVPSSYFPSA